MNRSARTASRCFTRAEIVIHQDDFNFWSDDEARRRSPRGGAYVGAADALGCKLSRRFRTSSGGKVLDGITQLPLPGHTPGHGSWPSWTRPEKTLVIWGDTVHVPEIQIPRLQVTSEFDVDEGLAAENRRRIFQHAPRTNALL